MTHMCLGAANDRQSRANRMTESIAAGGDSCAVTGEVMVVVVAVDLLLVFFCVYAFKSLAEEKRGSFKMILKI